MGEGIGQILIFVVIAIVAVVGGYFAHLAEKKKRAALAAWAAANGFSWSPAKRSGGPYPFPPFQSGHSRYSRYHMSKTHPGPTPGLGQAGFDLFEYHYAETSGSGKNRRTTHYYFTCAAIKAPADMGEVDVRPEHWGDRLAGAFGFDDIDFEDPDFSKRYHVSARDRRDAYDLITSPMMRYLTARAGGWKMRFVGPLLVVHIKGRVKPERYTELVSFVEGLLAQLPRTMVNAERAKQGLPPILEGGAAATTSRSDLIGGA